VITYWAEGSGGPAPICSVEPAQAHHSGLRSSRISIRFADGRWGFLNDRLYLLGGTGVLNSLVPRCAGGRQLFAGVDGYSATRGYDLPTGWGTPNFGILGTILADPYN